MPVPIQYRGQGSVQATYDWLDFLSRDVGYKSFYLACAKTSGSNEYMLTPIAVTASVGSTNYSGASGTQNFDMTFKHPQIIAAGHVFLNFSMSTGPNTGNTVTITVKHVTSGGTETDLGSGATARSADAISNEMMKIAVTAKVFKIDEKLRITFATVMTGSGQLMTLYHNPQEATYLPFRVWLPFKIL